MGQFFKKYDLLVTPTVFGFALPLNTVGTELQIGLDKWNELEDYYVPYTNLFNSTGQSGYLPPISSKWRQPAFGHPICGETCG
jgi:Asp-tRNA(Asn)/Glu-tRNA(Gln) amidotransferase A subunit family amidase